MKIEGSFPVDAPRGLVWEKIRDPAVMGSCIPGCEAIEKIDDMSYRAVVGVKVGPIKARFNLVVEVTREDEPERVFSRSRGEEGTRASVVSSENVLTLTEVDAGHTDVHYTSDVSMTGRLGKYGLGIMQKKADALGAEFAQAFRARVEAEAVGP